MDWLHATTRQVTTVQLVIAGAMAAILMGILLYRTMSLGIWLRGQISAFERRLVFAGLVTIALVSALNYFYVARSRQFLHRWDLFHTVMTTRYFEEIGYDKLYECAYVIDQENSHHFSEVDRIRDLETLRHVSTSGLVRRPAGQAETTPAPSRPPSDSDQRFSPERKAAFARDLEFFFELTPSKSRWQKILNDKGYNGTPLYTALMRLLVGDGELSLTRLQLLSLIDVLLILLAFALVARSFGPAVGLISFIFFCVNFPNRFDHMGGSILRFDYVVLLIVAICMLRSDPNLAPGKRRRRYGIAGAAMALAAMERGFPLLFAVGLAIKAGAEILASRRLAGRYLWFAGGFVAAALVAAAVSLTTDGFETWRGFADNMAIHNQRSAGFRIGFKHMFMMDGNLSGTDGFILYEQKQLLFEGRQLAYWVGVAAFMAPLALLVRKLSDLSFTIIFGLLALFLVFVATRYYYSVLVLVLLLDYDWLRHRVQTGTMVLAFAITAITYFSFFHNPYPPFIYNTLFTSLLCGLYAYLLVGLTVHHYRRAPRATS